MTSLILASQSPRRRELLSLLGIPFSCEPSFCQEDLPAGIDPMEGVALLARRKALDVAGRYPPIKAVLGADTLVVCDGIMLGKPVDGKDASKMLHLLSGRSHEVMTALALVCPDGRIREAVELTRVFFTPMTDEEIEAYVISGEPMDKAGAYGIQGRAAIYIDRIEGCYYNVMGLPLARLKKMLEGVAFG